jgi:hypothetical protein
MSHTELWPILRIAATVVSGAPEVIAETAQQKSLAGMAGCHRANRSGGTQSPGRPGRRGPSGARRGPHAGPTAEKGRLRKSTAICDLPPRLRDFQRIFWIDNRDIAGGPRKTRHQTATDRIGRQGKNDRDRRANSSAPGEFLSPCPSCGSPDGSSNANGLECRVLADQTGVLKTFQIHRSRTDS